MSDEEEVYSEEEAPASKPSETEVAMQKRRQVNTGGLDDDARELLEENRKEREGMEAEIRELRERSERRKKERAEEEARLAEQRQQEEAARKAAEEERRAKKDEEDRAKREARASKMAEFEKLRSAKGPNFVINKSAEKPKPKPEGEEQGQEEKKSKEQLENEKRAILAQRIKPLEIDGAGTGKLQEEAKRLHKEILRLEGEKYDLEKRFKEQQYDMMELAERARQINKVGKGGLKRVQLGADETDKIQEMVAGAPAKIEMYSRYERQKDKRSYGEKHTVFHGPTWCFPAERIKPQKIVNWDPDTGLPIYEEIEGAGGEQQEVAVEE